MDDCEQFLFMGRVIPFSGVELAGLEGDRVPFAVEILLQNCAEGVTGSVGGNSEGKAGSK
jgi:hypothetical protein